MMICVTFISFFIITRAADIGDSEIERKINATLQTKTIPDAALLLDLQTFVNHDGLKTNASDAANKAALRSYPIYYLPEDKDMRLNVLDIMRQSVYTSQERMLALEPILKKYENDPSLRMAFIFNRLRQLIIDMRRLYTLMSVYTTSWYHPVFKYIFWYSFIVRKYFDVLYIVEHVIELFKDYIRNIDKQNKL